MVVIVGLSRPELTDQLKLNIPAHVRDDLFDGVNDAELQIDRDERGRFLKVRPVVA